MEDVRGREFIFIKVFEVCLKEEGFAEGWEVAQFVFNPGSGWFDWYPVFTKGFRGRASPDGMMNRVLGVLVAGKAVGVTSVVVYEMIIFAAKFSRFGDTNPGMEDFSLDFR